MSCEREVKRNSSHTQLASRETRDASHVSRDLRLVRPVPTRGTFRSMSSSDSPSPTPTSTTPPKQRPSNKASPSPLRPHPTPQPSSSQKLTTLPITSPRLVSGSIASPATPPPERSKSRARDLLRKHYGLSVTPPPPSGRPMDPMDLGERSSRNIPYYPNQIADSPAFDAKAYYDQLITTSSLTTLLKKENELLTGESLDINGAYSRLTHVLSRDEAAGWRTSISRLQ